MSVSLDELPDWFVGMVLAVGVVIGLSLLLVAFRQTQTIAWESTPAEVTAVSIHSTSQEVGGRTVRSYRPRVSYRYVVDGRTYSGARISFQAPTSRYERTIQEYLAERGIRVGLSVPCYYDADQPHESVLVAESLWLSSPLWSGLAILVLTLLGGWARFGHRLVTDAEVREFLRRRRETKRTNDGDRA